MTRRELLSIAAAGAVSPASAEPLMIPVHHILDRRARITPDQIDAFRSRIWPEAAADCARCGIQFQTILTTGEVRRSPSGQPVFAGLERGVINLVITDHIPMEWDKGRALSGV